MKYPEPIQVVDLFAGPGGLGEGFASFNQGQKFKILVSAEMDKSARSTLRLRAFYRQLKSKKPSGLADYYAFCNGSSQLPYSVETEGEWHAADQEARCITLGSLIGDQELDAILDSKLDPTKPWVLIGGPPCQAYSIVGRSRNKGKVDYEAENDHRHFLYREYLRILQERKPSVFVMENVKGILSSKIGNEKIFPKILQDLADPDLALGLKTSGRKYRICSFVSDIYYDGGSSENLDYKKYVINSEIFGIPQTRHRVILLGIAVDANGDIPKFSRLNEEAKVSVGEVIDSLPQVRSRLTDGEDSDQRWYENILNQFEHLQNHTDPLSDLEFSLHLNIAKKNFLSQYLSVGSLRYQIKSDHKKIKPKFQSWYVDKNLTCLLNHDARGHMNSDLRRYLYSSVFAKAFNVSPKGHHDFSMPGLAPDHKNWETGKFSDRFRVQVKDRPSSTITSHISKDGHYFIHYDSTQCRSLTVREAARIQTFPDNYFFMGNRTQQFQQVGNAVPPLLAQKMAGVVAELMSKISS